MTKNLVMVGAGGTGSHLFHPLMCYLDVDDTLYVYDADHVERKNLTRQLFYEYDLTENKANALARRFPERVISKPEYIGEDNIAKAIREGDIVLICADNMAVRRAINAHAKTLDDIVVINGGNELETGSVQVYVRQDGVNVTPPLDFFSPEFKAEDNDPDMATLSCAEIAELPGGEQTVVANNSVAALMLQALVRLDKGVYEKEEQWTKVTFDVEAGLFQPSDVRAYGDFNA
jgi:molybdopterin/thiamine biosynthesis adenylyltransferase